MKATINNALLARLLPGQKPYDVRDDKLTGFLVRVNISGKLLYMCEYARGKRVTIGKVGVLTVAQARDKAKAVLGDAVRGMLPATRADRRISGLLFTDFLEHDYIPWRQAHRKRANEDIKRVKVNFLEMLGQTKISEIDVLQIERWRSKRIHAGTKAATVNRDVNVLKAILNKAKEWGMVNHNPLQSIKPIKEDSTPKVRYLDEKEEQRLIEILYKRDNELKSARKRGNLWKEERSYDLLPDLTQCAYADHMTPMVFLSLNTGLRRGELFALEWEDINFNKALLTVKGGTAKSGKTRYIPLNEYALGVLKGWRKQSQSNNLVFSGKEGKQFTHVKKAWFSILKMAKIDKFRWHDMRHHFASHLVMMGVDLNTVRELLGHADLSMTLRYAHLAPEHKANAVSKLVKNNKMRMLMQEHAL
jgi:integrase